MKVLKNTTLSDIFITDTGVNLLASSSLTLNPTEYTLWASSSDIITHIGSGAVVVNDGTEDLSKALGISLLQSNFRDTDFVDELKTSGRLRVSVYHENGGGSSTDEKVKISATDTTTDYLENKIEGVAGRIAISKLNTGVDESLQIDVGNQILDRSTDTTDALSEGVSNLYFTDNRAKDSAANSVTSATHDGVSTSYNSTTKELSFTNTDKGSTAMSAHLADSDPHTQYLRVDGVRAMSGNLDMGTSSIINVGTVDGVDVSAHASRHLPNGADPLATGTPSTIGTANNTGVANAFARQDHVHDHGNQTNGSHHAAATTSVNGFMSSADKTKLDGITSLTTGSVPFSNGSTLTQDNANLFFDDTNNRLGVGTNTPDSTLTVKGAGAGKVNLGGWSGDTSYGALSLNGGIADPNNYNFISSNADQTLYVNRPLGKDIYIREGNDAAAATTTVFKSSGNVGIGDTAPAYKLTVDGVIHSKTGGYRFPDGTVQTTAATGGGRSAYNTYFTTTTQSTTLNTHSDITQLTSTSLTTGVYRVHVTGLFQSAGATSGAGFRIAPGTATIGLYIIDWEVQQGVDGTDQDFEYKQLNATTNVTSASVATVNTNYRFNGWGIIRITGAGTGKVQFRSELAGTATTVQIDSALILEKLS